MGGLGLERSLTRPEREEPAAGPFWISRVVRHLVV